MPNMLLRLTDEQMQSLRAVKRVDGISMSEFVRRAFDAALKAWDAAHRSQTKRDQASAWNRL